MDARIDAINEVEFPEAAFKLPDSEPGQPGDDKK
jgi:hypothetical protein